MADNNPIRCDDCGKFIAVSDLCSSRLEHTPSSLLTFEEDRWTCPRCLDRIRQSRVFLG